MQQKATVIVVYSANYYSTYACRKTITTSGRQYVTMEWS